MDEIRVLIIDDEELARELIRNFLKEYGEFRIIGETDNGLDGVRLIKDLQPDLVFLDVQMPRISGLEVLDLLEKPVPFIIFSTAYDTYAVEAFEKNAIDYLLKPYNRDRFNKAVEKFLNEFRKSGSKIAGDNILKIKSRENKVLDKVLVRHGSRIVVIPVEEIVYIGAEDDYVSIHTMDKKYLKQTTMGYFVDALPGNKFTRIHRSFIINVDFLVQLDLYDKATYTAVMKNKERLPVSRSGSVKLKLLLGNP
ncbi:MAG TPA: LytTR family DNA-binding domain-containing protein [Cyclobacteriaceae bacterium]|nr:LytTR family DNA-binding domain-containing protein [Cyclobacteriaceae bacterium]